jgi:hypothetical protein
MRVVRDLSGRGYANIDELMAAFTAKLKNPDLSATWPALLSRPPILPLHPLL